MSKDLIPVGHDNKIIASILRDILTELQELNAKQPSAFKRLISNLYLRIEQTKGKDGN